MVWLSSPPGAGKTTLLEHHIERHQRPVLWLELEPDDDLASLFQRLHHALEQPLAPSTTPESPEACARALLPRLLSALGPHAALVLDNYERLPPRSPAHALFAALGERLPPTSNLLVSSRSEPPPAYARLRMHGRLTTLDWQALRLTDEESTAMAERRLGHALPPGQLERLQARAGGWAAGLLLLCESARAKRHFTSEHSEPVLGDAASDDETQVVFDYFAGEVFEHTDPILREVLLDTAFLPRFSAATAARLSGRPDASERLRAFADRGYFTLRRGDIYQYHFLFRDFLCQRARQERGLTAVVAMQRVAAQSLVEDNEPGAAIELLSAIGDHDAIALLVRAHAPAWLDRGRAQTVGDWIKRLPSASVESEPWLLTWRAAASLQSDERLSQRDFASAHAMFVANGDADGAYRTWAGAVESQVYRWRHAAPLDPWLDRLAELEARFPAVHDPALEARIASAAFMAIFWRRPQHPGFAHWHARARGAFERTTDVTPRLLLGGTLAFFMLMHEGDLPATLAFIDSVGVDPLDAELPPLPRLMWGFVVASARSFAGDTEAALAIASESLAVIDRLGLELMRDNHSSVIVYAHLSTGAYAAARAHLALERVAEAGSIAELCHLHYQHAWTALGEGDFLRAAEHCRLGLARAAESEDAWPAWGLGAVMAQVQIEAGEIEHGLAALDALDRHPFSASRMYRQHRVAIDAWLALRRGDEDQACVHLERLFAELGALRLVLPPLWGWRRPILRELLLFALERELAPEQVLRMLAASGLDAEVPPPSVERWPWPVRIRTLGGLSLEVDGRDVAEAQRASGRPLELLQALVAMGADRVRIPEARLMEALWPDSDGAVTLRTALHRLRRLIGAESVSVVGGTLALDPKRCWIDVRAFEARLAAKPRGDRAIQAVLALYRGRFLPDARGFWAIAPRERLHSTFVRWVQEVGAAHFAAGRFVEALELYLAALACDEASETLTLGLMTAQLGIGQRAAAVAAYQRCELALRGTVGVAPSAALRALLTQATRRSQ